MRDIKGHPKGVSPNQKKKALRFWGGPVRGKKQGGGGLRTQNKKKQNRETARDKKKGRTLL